MLRKIGFEVSFISVVDADLVDNYVEDLQKRGIECIYPPYLKSIEHYIQENGKYFDLVMLFRAPYGGRYIDVVRKYAPQAKVVFNTVDLHFLREKREIELIGKKLKLSENVTDNKELGIMKRADMSIVVSDYEQYFLASFGENINLRVIPLATEIPGRNNGFAGRRNLVFIGGYLHRPNVDAVLYFVKEIWPSITNAIHDCEFWIVGSNVPDELEKLAGEKIKVIGFVPDLEQVFSTCMMTVAPLRFGAGIKGKILTSFSYGVPCVATSIAVEGMGLTHEHNVLVGDTPDEFASAIVKLYTDRETWEKLSDNGLTFLKENYSLENFEKNLRQLVCDLGIEPVNTEFSYKSLP
jgi:glycosyltransferase involved in cell wall biosynthesis